MNRDDKSAYVVTHFNNWNIYLFLSASFVFQNLSSNLIYLVEVEKFAVDSNYFRESSVRQNAQKICWNIEKCLVEVYFGATVGNLMKKYSITPS